MLGKEKKNFEHETNEDTRTIFPQENSTSPILPARDLTARHRPNCTKKATRVTSMAPMAKEKTILRVLLPALWFFQACIRMTPIDAGRLT